MKTTSSRSEFGGFHRIEKALWEEETTEGHEAGRRRTAKRTSKNWKRKSRASKLQAVQIANGANELLTEVSTSKITGEEERYSHIDLVDFKANVEGSQVAFEAVAPLMEENGPETGEGNRRRLRSRLRLAEALRNEQVARLRPLRGTDKADTRKLAQAINALAEKLSLVPAQIAKGDTGVAVVTRRGNP